MEWSFVKNRLRMRGKILFDAPLTYLAGYFAAMLFFAILYMVAVPHQLYAPYARFEPDARQDLVAVQVHIANSIRRMLRPNATYSFENGDWVIYPPSIRATNLASDDGETVFFSVRFEGRGEGRFDKGRMYWTIPVLIHAQAEISAQGANGDWDTYRIPELNRSKLDGDVSSRESMFRAMFSADSTASSGDFLPVTPRLLFNREDESMFDRFLAGLRGDPSAISGQFSRMLYFSAVVITTLGLGDIVPLTNAARLLVALEAISGIVIAGLFVNSVAVRASAAAER
ncbi:pH-gated potassium channel KcsA [Burkholderia sp. AD24]|nr:pH-gated potassium channel KcsA [Burkholderia sp. AD24]